MKKRNFLELILLSSLFLLLSCGSATDKGPVLSKEAVLEITPKSVNDSYGSVSVGEYIVENFVIKNTGNKNLKIEEIKLIYTPVNSELETSPENYAFQLEFQPGLEPPVEVAYPENTTGDAPKEYYFNLKIKNLGDDIDRTAKIAIKSNSSNTQNGYTYVEVTVTSGRPKIKVSPQVVDFGRVGFNETKTEEVTVRNQGSTDLILSKFEFSSSAPFKFKFNDTEISPDDNTAAGVNFDPKIVIHPDQAITFEFSYSPESEDPAVGQFVIYSNDPDAPEGTVIQLQANQNLPCIEVNPSEINFGPVLPSGQKKLPVEIKNCGLIDLEIYSIKIVDDNQQAYFLELDSLFGTEEPYEISEDQPFIVPSGETRTFSVRYAPSELSPLDPDTDKIIPDTAVLEIVNNSFYNDLKINMKGICSEVICPTPIITVDEGEQVIPQTVLHLHGDQSYSPNGEIKYYKWEVQQPEGSQSAFIPSSDFPNPIFEANVAGEYIFTLNVVDSAGISSEQCAPAVYKVTVIPDEAIHIELLWNTPNDPDQTDEGPDAGTDMDLHFAHPFAAGPDIDGDGQPDPWFNIPYDVFWFNKEPEWGSLDPSIDDNPSLDRDDTDGAGPENVNLNIPEGTENAPFKYRVGVHYWDDKGFGPSYATVRVYIYAVKVFEVSDVKMNNHELWDVCTVEWPSTKVELILDNNGNYKITPYTPPL